MNKNSGIKILGTGSYKPEFVVKNSDFAEFIETDDEWIISRTGIRERRYNLAEPNYLMAVKAAERALESANMNNTEGKEGIDMIIVSTATPDTFYPSTSCIVQNHTGAKNACAIDINVGCTGFVNALDIARSYLSCGTYRRILVVSSEMLSRQTDFTDRTTCVLFGDGAGAVVVESAPDKKYSAILGAIGEDCRDMKLKCPVNYENTNPFSKSENMNKSSGFIEMNGKEVYKFASDIMPKAVIQACGKIGWGLSDIDLLIPHQANIRIINAAMRNLDIPEDKVYINIERTGNISSACIPVCLDELYADGRIKSGMRVCLVAFGAGLTYGSTPFFKGAWRGFPTRNLPRQRPKRAASELSPRATRPPKMFGAK
jgi:3-oxoacyl-[acyl-carrier-protein] synthase-3